MFSRRFIYIIVLLLSFINHSTSAIPDNIDYQGYLADTGGSPVSGTVSVTFNLYNVDAGGISLWSDTQSVTVTNGLFNVKLGSAGNPFPVGLFDAPLYIGIDVSGDGEMSPRVAMSSAGFSHKAADADSVGGISAGSLVTSTELAAHSDDTANPHAVTAAQTGAATSASFSLHTGDPSVHHSKTTSFTELTDTAADAQIPDNITINQAANADTLDGLDSIEFMSASKDDWVNVTGDTMTGPLYVMDRIGIGTTTPSYSLDVRGNSNVDLGVFINTNTSPVGSSGIFVRGNAFGSTSGEGKGGTFRGDGGNLGGDAYGVRSYAYAYGTSTAYGVMSMATGGFTSGREWAFYGLGDTYISGNVGIGTTTPTEKLTVAGMIESTVGGVKYPDGTVQDSTVHTHTFADMTDQAMVAQIPDNWVNVTGDTMSGNLNIIGSLGIGTETPGNVLDIQGNVSNYLANINNTTTAVNSFGLYTKADSYSSGSGTARAAHFYGRGGSTGGTAYASANFAYAYGASDAYGVFSNATGGTTTGREWAFFGYGDLAISGDMGVGSSNPGSRLAVSGGATIGSTYNSSVMNNGDMAISGNLGIGTSTPAYRLDVTGDSPNDYVGYFDNTTTTGWPYGIRVVAGNSGPGTRTAVGGDFVSVGGDDGGSSRGVRTIAYANGTGNAYGLVSSVGGTTTGLKYAIWSNGALHVNGDLSKGGGSFKIDHPLDPENKYLYHSFVESPDMMNIYNGNVVLDSNGEAKVTMPIWFKALNRDYRYQLTAVGSPGPNLYIAEKMAGNSFKIAGGEPGMEVSWQVTGIRQDAYANANRIPVEEDKKGDEVGTYLHPEVFGISKNRGLGYMVTKDRFADVKQ